MKNGHIAQKIRIYRLFFGLRNEHLRRSKEKRAAYSCPQIDVQLSFLAKSVIASVEVKEISRSFLTTVMVSI